MLQIESSFERFSVCSGQDLIAHKSVLCWGRYI